MPSKLESFLTVEYGLTKSGHKNKIEEYNITLEISFEIENVLGQKFKNCANHVNGF